LYFLDFVGFGCEEDEVVKKTKEINDDVAGLMNVCLSFFHSFFIFFSIFLIQQFNFRVDLVNTWHAK
jgi:hypothetical protein